MITASEVLQILRTLSRAGIEAWVDGGWGIDALLGEQTRPHEDLDLVIAIFDGERALKALSVLGFSLGEDERPTRFVAAAPDGRHVDFHTVNFDEEGGGIQLLQDGRSYRYPQQGFRGEGVIGGEAVRCLTTEVQLECHLGYDPDDTDRHDMRLLAERFGLRLPTVYRDEERS